MLKRIFAYIMTACLLMSSLLGLISCDNTGDTSDPAESTSASGTTSDTAESTSDSTTADDPPKEPTSIKFSLFSDFHYKANMYMSTIADMDAITKRANDNSVDFLMQTGDFSNDYAGSPELMNAYLQNKYNIPAYGVYGNHELESSNSMSIVTPLINSEADSVTWGTADGTIGDKNIAYYYFELNGFRVICLDTNYSYNTSKAVWEHNRSGSYGPPSGNTNTNSLGPVQEAWLKIVLNDAADKDIPCIIFSHIGFSGAWSSAYNHEAIRSIFKEVNQKKPGTVIAAFSGHLHTNRSKIVDGVFYMDVNTAKNGCWKGSQTEHHYTDETFSQVIYDVNGNPTDTIDKKLTSLSQAKNTWFFTDPLSAIVTILSDGTVIIEGSDTTWLNNVKPSNVSGYVTPKILSGIFFANGKKY